MKTSTVFLILLVSLWSPCAGQVMLKDINPNGSGNPGPKIVMDGILYFVADDGQHGYELWRSDGTTAGTRMVRDINPAGNAFSKDQALKSFNGVLYFIADDGIHGKELWRSDGEEQGTELVGDINPSGGSNPSELTMTGNNILMFAANDWTHGIELWKVSASGGAEMVMDINPTGDGAPHRFIAYGNMVLFAAKDSDAHGIELWKSDGSGSGTSMIADLHPSGDSNPRSLIAFNNKIYFVATDGTYELLPDDELHEMWTTDGQTIGKISNHIDFKGKSHEGIFSDLFVADGNLFFWSIYDQNVVVLWRSDGTAEGTETFEYGQSFWFLGGYMACDSRVYFVQRTEFNNWLRVFDSDSSAFLDLAYPPDEYDPDIRFVHCYYNNVYVELNGFWKTEGAGVCPVTAASSNFFEIDGELYSVGGSLWKFDASECNATEVGAINPSATGNPAGHVAVMDGAAYFTADDGTAGAELWRYPEPEVLSVSKGIPGAKPAVKIYPVPASNHLVLETRSDNPGNCNIRVRDMMGRKMFETTVNPINSNRKINLDVTSLPLGSYLLEIRFDHKTFYGKFVK